jgi:(S)-ureidoglycine aminohydrolase
MTMQPGTTRTVVTRSYALIAPDGHVLSALPGWNNCRAVVLISAAMGARFSQYLITLDEEGRGEGETGPDEWFFYIVEGAARVNGESLAQGGYAYVPPRAQYSIRSVRHPTTMIAFRKPYESLAGQAAPALFTGREQEQAESPLIDDTRVRLKTLISDTPSADMAVNILTYDPGATLPFVETHVMEHGMLFLAGGGVYRLDSDWHAVTSGDAIWIAPYCAQWFIAAGPAPARYIYYKDINRLP